MSYNNTLIFLGLTLLPILFYKRRNTLRESPAPQDSRNLGIITIAVEPIPINNRKTTYALISRLYFLPGAQAIFFWLCWSPQKLSLRTATLEIQYPPPILVPVGFCYIYSLLHNHRTTCII